MSKKIIAVVGATGAQGGGVVRAILADKGGEFVARAITRKPEGDAGKALAAQGVQVVPGNIDDLASMKRAFEGAHAVFCVTNFWEHFSTDREIAQAGVLAQAAKETGIKHAIWSTLEDTRKKIPLSDNRMPTLKEKYKVPHFDAKAEGDALFAKHGVPTTYLLTSFYWDNMIHFGMGPKKGPDGKLAITMPMGKAKLPGIAAEDIGGCAYGVFKKGAELIGQRVGIAGEHLTGAEMARALTQALGQEIVYNDVPPELYRSFGFPGADDLGNMFQYKRDFEADFCAARDVNATKKLYPQLQNFATWLSRNKSRIALG